MKAYKVKLKLNNKQKSMCYQYARTSHFAYNWCLEKQITNYKNGGKFLQDGEIRKQFTNFKKENLWLYRINNNVTKQAIKDCCEAYIKFFKKEVEKPPKFKSKKKSKLSFYQDAFYGFKIIENNRVQLSNIGIVKFYEKNYIPILESSKYKNIRISSDGVDWYMSLAVDKQEEIKQFKNDGIGIDLGLKNFAILNDGTKYKNINKTKKIKQLEKRQRRLQRAISRKYLQNKDGNKFIKTSNIYKQEKKLKKIYRRITNIRTEYTNKIINNILEREPSFIVLEDLNISGMMKNKHLSKAIGNSKFYEFRTKLQNKLTNTTSQIILADRFYPSSKICNHCGTIKKDLKLKDRVYHCECGYTEDRDVNASKNLYELGKTQIKLRKAS